MAETIRNGKGWLWADIMHDLKNQGGISEARIDPLSINPGQCKGTYKERDFFLTWSLDDYLLLSMTHNDDLLLELVDAFSKVLEYNPFCKYQEGNIFTYEWDKNDPNGRFNELSEKRNLANLVRI